MKTSSWSLWWLYNIFMEDYPFYSLKEIYKITLSRTSFKINKFHYNNEPIKALS